MHDTHNVDIQALVNVRVTKEVNGVMKTGIIKTTPGRIIFNSAIPQNLGYLDRSKSENELQYEVNEVVGSSSSARSSTTASPGWARTKTSHVLDRIKSQGFHYSTMGAITVSVSDIQVPAEKKEYIEGSQQEDRADHPSVQKRLLNGEERKGNVVNVWTETTNKVTEALASNLDDFNPINMMAKSGAKPTSTRSVSWPA